CVVCVVVVLCVCVVVCVCVCQLLPVSDCSKGFLLHPFFGLAFTSLTSPSVSLSLHLSLSLSLHLSLTICVYVCLLVSLSFSLTIHIFQSVSLTQTHLPSGSLASLFYPSSSLFLSTSLRPLSFSPPLSGRSASAQRVPLSSPVLCWHAVSITVTLRYLH